MPNPVTTGHEKKRRGNRGIKKNQKTVSPRKKPLKCNLCRYTTTVQNKMLTHVVKEHVEKKPFHCNLCNFKSSTHQSYKRHLKTHTGGERFECGVCDFTTTQPLILENHIRLHTKEIPYGCDRCNFRTTNQSALLTHVETHTEENPNICFLCENRDATLSSLNAKRKGCRLCRLHSCACFNLTTLHLCAFCQKDCIERWSYRRTTIHFTPNSRLFYNYVDDILTCTICRRTFKAKIGYFSHMQSHLRNCKRFIVAGRLEDQKFSFNCG